MSCPNTREVAYIFDQKFEDIEAECLRKKKLFRDPNFPANSASFYMDFDEMNPRIVHKWLRPGEIVEKPVLIANGISRFQTCQHSNGSNRWFIAAVSNFAHLQLSENELFRHVIPEEQSFEKNYAGIFRFRFWQCGEWVEVVIDDRLPTLNGVVLSLSSDNPCEFWSALLEKAYAKLYGSYEALGQGFGSEGFVDLTGSIATTYLRPYPCDFFCHLMEAFNNNAFIGCCYQPNTEKPSADEYYYLVTDVKLVSYEYLGDKGEAKMLRVRNSWGDDRQWCGPATDCLLEWNIMPQVIKDALNLYLENDGEFWISYTDFTKKFCRVEICEKPPYETNTQWGMKSRHGYWDENGQLVCCGKHDDQTSTLWVNPQYFITVEKDDTRVIIDLIDKSRRKKCQPVQTLEYFVYSLCMNTHRSYKKFCKLDKDYLASKKHLLLHKSVKGRELSCSLTLDMGTYAIVPAREHVDESGDFYLRILHDKQLKLQTFE